jgi:hypothetical protein
LSIRSIQRKARRDLHLKAQVPAYYYATASSDPVLVHVRVHAAFGAVGQVRGARFYGAEMEDESPKIRFDLVELSDPARGAIVSVAAGEAYHIDHMEQPDDEFQFAKVTRLDATELAALTLRVPAP